MRKTIAGFLLLLCCTLIWSCKPNKTFNESKISLIPQVRKMTLGESSFQFNKNTQFLVENPEQEAIAGQLTVKFEKAAGYKPAIQVGGTKGTNQIIFQTDPTLADEAYSLIVLKNQIEIKASKPAGFFYAVQTLRQLLPAEIESNQLQEKTEWVVPVINISDSPAFKWRGYMLDVSRHFFTKEEVLRMIDNISLHKINL